MTNYRYPSAEQIQRMERAARRARAEEFARLAKSAASAVKSLFAGRQMPIKGPRHA
jgi:hypothetical protein